MVRWPWQKAPNPLGDGVWRRAHDRFRRAVDRYHQMLESVPDGPGSPGDRAGESVRDALQRTGASLARALDDVHDVCEAAQQCAPSAGLDVPGAWSDVHRSISAAATSVAQAAEAAAMVRVSTEPGGAQARANASAAARAAQRATSLVAQARREADLRGSGPGRTPRSG